MAAIVTPTSEDFLAKIPREWKNHCLVLTLDTCFHTFTSAASLKTLLISTSGPLSLFPSLLVLICTHTHTHNLRLHFFYSLSMLGCFRCGHKVNSQIFRLFRLRKTAKIWQRAMCLTCDAISASQWEKFATFITSRDRWLEHWFERNPQWSLK